VENAEILIKDYLFQSIIQTIGHGNNRVIELFEFLLNKIKLNRFVKQVNQH
jgi:hypothetical protein